MVINALSALPDAHKSVKKGKWTKAAEKVVLAALDRHPKTKSLNKNEKLLKLDIVKNAVNEHFAAPTHSGLVVSGTDRIPMLQGPESSIMNESTLSNSFAMQNLPKNDPFHDFASDSVCIKGVEYLGTISTEYEVSKLGMTLFMLRMNPTTWSNTRVAKYASLFNYYRFDSVEVIYEPTVPKTQAGTLCAAILPNVAKKIPEYGIDGLRATMELRNAIMFPVSQVQTMTYKFSTPTAPLLCMPSQGSVSTIGSTLVDQGKLFFKDASSLASPAAKITWGQVIVKYKLCLYDSCVTTGNEPTTRSVINTAFSASAGSVINGVRRIVLATAGFLAAAADVPTIVWFTLDRDVACTPNTRLSGRIPYWAVVPATSTGVGALIYSSFEAALSGGAAALTCDADCSTGPAAVASVAVVDNSAVGPYQLALEAQQGKVLSAGVTQPPTNANGSNLSSVAKPQYF